MHMNRRVTLIICIVIVVVVIAFVGAKQLSTTLSMNKLTVTSTEFDAGGKIPSTYTCDGSDTNPPFDVSNIPAGTKSIAFTLTDPDTRSGTWVHWVKWNIVPTIPVLTIKKGKEPAGVSGSGSSGSADYQGPCPPSGTHHYILDVYALDTTLNLLGGSSRDTLLSAMKGRVLAQGQLIGIYSRLSQ